MTPEQLALEQLDISKLQTWITGLAIFFGPLFGVLFTLWFQGRKEKNDQKQKLFLALMAHRKSNPPTFELVNSLNLIDVVFSKHRKVVELWHQYLDLLSQQTVNWTLAESKYLDLLSEIAKVLGYHSLAQTDISRFYSPVAHGTQAQMSQEMQQEFLRVLRNSARIPVDLKEEDAKS